VSPWLSGLAVDKCCLRRAGWPPYGGDDAACSHSPAIISRRCGDSFSTGLSHRSTSENACHMMQSQLSRWHAGPRRRRIFCCLAVTEVIALDPGAAKSLRFDPKIPTEDVSSFRQFTCRCVRGVWSGNQPTFRTACAGEPVLAAQRRAGACTRSQHRQAVRDFARTARSSRFRACAQVAGEFQLRPGAGDISTSVVVDLDRLPLGRARAARACLRRAHRRAQ